MVDQYNLYLHLSLMKGFILSVYKKSWKETVFRALPSTFLPFCRLLASW